MRWCHPPDRTLVRACLEISSMIGWDSRDGFYARIKYMIEIIAFLAPNVHASKMIGVNFV